MAGFPGILTRLGLGPLFRNRGKIRNPETAFSAEQMNLLLWQVAGMNGLSARAFYICTFSGGVITPIFKWLAWDPNASLPMNTCTFAVVGVGNYSSDFSAASFPDQAGASVPLAFNFAMPVAGAVNRSMIGTVNPDGKSGSFRGYDLSADADGDVSRFALFLF